MNIPEKYSKRCAAVRQLKYVKYNKLSLQIYIKVN